MCRRADKRQPPCLICMELGEESICGRRLDVACEGQGECDTQSPEKVGLVDLI